jgi:hypothetical protein
MDADDFLPYVAFKAGDEELARFMELTHLSYSLAQQLLFATPKASLPRISLPTPPFAELSFGEHSTTPSSVELISEWISLEEYAQRANAEMRDLTARAAQGELGPVEDEFAEVPKYIWPPDYASRPREDLPEPGKKSFDVKVDVRAIGDLPHYDLKDPEAFDHAQQTYLRLAHALGDPDEIRSRAEAMLARAAFLVLWTNFEVFLRETVVEMLRRHPGLLVRGKRGRQTLEYAELFEMTEGFSSPSEIQQVLIQREVERLRGGSESVHGLINFLKGQLHFKKDPYTAWYQWKGERRHASFDALLELKNLRNALVHEGQPPTDSSLELTTARVHEARLLLTALCHRISRQIAKAAYTPEA